MALSLLIVDDSPIVRSMLVRTLQGSGLPVTAIHQAGDLASAFATLATTEVDAAIVDHALPHDEDEVSFLERLRAHPRLAGLGVVMVIPADAMPGTAADVSACGATPLRTPFTPEQVRVAVLRVTGALRDSA